MGVMLIRRKLLDPLDVSCSSPSDWIAHRWFLWTRAALPSINGRCRVQAWLWQGELPIFKQILWMQHVSICCNYQSILRTPSYLGPILAPQLVKQTKTNYSSRIFWNPLVSQVFKSWNPRMPKKKHRTLATTTGISWHPHLQAKHAKPPGAPLQVPALSGNVCHGGSSFCSPPGHSNLSQLQQLRCPMTSTVLTVCIWWKVAITGSEISCAQGAVAPSKEA